MGPDGPDGVVFDYKNNVMAKRLVWIPGFGEDERIFRGLLPAFPDHEAVVVNYTRLMPELPANPTLADLGTRVAAAYGIAETDTVIGHSMGGYIAHYLKERTGCTAVLLMAYSESTRKKFRWVPGWLLWFLVVLLGVFRSRLVRWASSRRYRKKLSWTDINNAWDNLSSWPKRTVYKLLKVLVNPPPPLTAQPDLWLHGSADRIVAYPKPWKPIVLEGHDHFVLATHPELVLPHLQTVVKA